MWRDATGKRVGILSPNEGTNFRFVAPDGNVWRYNEDSGQVEVPGPASNVHYFASSDCTGTAFLRVIWPTRTPFVVTAEAGSPLHVRSDTVAPIAMVPGSTKILGTTICNTSATSPVQVVPLASTVPATPLSIPAVPFTLPVHPEYVP